MSLADLLSWLGSPAFFAFGAPLSNAEVFGFATGLVCVWLVVRKSIWNFPVGILNCALLFFLFWDSRLFADATLQILFIALGVHGWWQWLHGRVDHQIQISQLGVRGLLAACAAGIGISLTLFVLLSVVKGSVPVFDALITGLSLVAQYLLNRRKLESWYFWITVDVISIPVYAYKELYLIAILYAVFLMLCLLGLREWRRSGLAVSFAKADPEPAL